MLLHLLKEYDGGYVRALKPGTYRVESLFTPSTGETLVFVTNPPFGSRYCIKLSAASVEWVGVSSEDVL